MKKSILLLFLCFNTAMLTAQNNLSIAFQSGAGLVLETGFQIENEPDRIYLGPIEDFSIDRVIYPPISLGVAYETPTVHLLNKDYYLLTDLNVKYENYKEFYFEGILITNTVYLPTKVKEKKLRAHLGVRNSFIVHDFEDRAIVRIIYPVSKHRIGASFLLNYKVNDKLDVGLNLYTDINEACSVSVLGPRSAFRTQENTIRLTYGLF